MQEFHFFLKLIEPKIFSRLSNCGKKTNWRSQYCIQSPQHSRHYLLLKYYTLDQQSKQFAKGFWEFSQQNRYAQIISLDPRSGHQKFPASNLWHQISRAQKEAPTHDAYSWDMHHTDTFYISKGLRCPSFHHMPNHLTSHWQDKLIRTLCQFSFSSSLFSCFTLRKTVTSFPHQNKCHNLQYVSHGILRLFPNSTRFHLHHYAS